MKHTALSKGKFAPQNREIKQPIVKTKAIRGVQMQSAATHNTSAAIVKKQKDNTVPTSESLAMSGVKKGRYRFAHGTKC